MSSSAMSEIHVHGGLDAVGYAKRGHSPIDCDPFLPGRCNRVLRQDLQDIRSLRQGLDIQP